MSARRPERQAGPPSSDGRPVRIGLSPRITIAQAQRLARWPGMALVVEDGKPFIEIRKERAWHGE